MMPGLKEDLRAVAAVVFGSAVCWVVTATVVREPRDHAVVRLEIRGPLLEVVREGNGDVGVPVTRTNTIPRQLRHGSRVDVLSLDDAHEGSRYVNEVVVREAEVLKSYLLFSREVNAQIAVVTLSVTAGEGERIHLARERGELHLAIPRVSKSP